MPRTWPRSRRAFALAAAALVLGTAACSTTADLRGATVSQVTRDGASVATLGNGVPAASVVAVLADRDVAVLSSSGVVEERLASLPVAAGEAVSIDLSADRRSIVVGVLDHQGVRCKPALLQLGPDGNVTQVAVGTGGAFSPDGDKLAYRRYRWEGGYCLEDALVIRDVASGEELVWPLPGKDPVTGTPPGWPINWSPDGRHVALVRDRVVVVLTVDTLSHQVVTGVRDAEGQVSADAPVFIDNEHVAVLFGCCVSDMPVVSVHLDTGARRHLFDAPGPIRSIRRDDGGELWFTVEEAGLWCWEGGEPERVATRGVEPLLVAI